MKKKITAIALIVALLAVAVIGGTLAYFTDTTEEVTNTFTMSDKDGVVVTLDEAPVEYDEDTHVWEIVDGDRVIENDYENVYPGAELPKDPTMHNEGEYDAYVRMDVTVTKAAELKALVEKYELDMADIFPDYCADWERFAEVYDETADTLTYCYIWNDVLVAGDDTDPIFETVVIPTAFTADDMATIDGFEITAFGFGIQADGDTAETLIAALKAMEKPAA